MLGRRSHPRCIVPASVEGVLSVSRDVVVQSGYAAPFTVVSREAGVPGERGELGLAGGIETIPVRIAASRPVTVDGSVRHLLELEAVLEGVVGAV